MVKSIPSRHKRRSYPVSSFGFLLKSKSFSTNTLIALRLAEFEEIHPDKFSREKHVSCDNFTVFICKNCQDNVQLNPEGGSLWYTCIS